MASQTQSKSPRKEQETFSPVKRDARRRPHLPRRHMRGLVFGLLSVLILASPLAYYCRQYDDPEAYQLSYDSDSEERASIERRLGKGKEIFTLIAESVTRMPDGFHAFDRAITRIADDAHRLQRDLRGLIYLSEAREHTQAVVAVAAKIEALSVGLRSRTLLEVHLRRLRLLLSGTVTAPAPPSSADEKGPTTERCADDDFRCHSRNFFRATQRQNASEPEAQSAPDGNGTKAAASAETSERPTVADIYRHFAWKRAELIGSIEATLWPDQQLPSGSATGRAIHLTAAVKKRMAHALALQRIGNGLSKASIWVSLTLAILVALFWYRMWVGRRYALGRGRWRAQLVFYVFFVLQVYNVVLVGAYQPDARHPGEEAIRTKTASLKDAYKTATQEIYHRLEQEQHFYILKFTMIGSLLAVFFRFLLSSDDEKEDSSKNAPKRRDAIDRLRESKVAAFFFWAAVLINCIVDTRLRYNAIICSALGRWIRTLESSVEEYGVTGWETFFDQQAPIASSPLMQVAPTLLTTIVFVLTVVLFLAKEQSTMSARGNIRDNLHPVNLVFGGIAFTIMAFSDLGQPGMPWEWAGPVLAWILAGIVVLGLGPKGIQARVFRKDEITDSLIGYAFPFHYFDFHNTPWRPDDSGLPGGRHTRSMRKWLQYGKYVLFMVAARLGSYVPIPALRRWLVRCVNKDLQLEFVHLEVNRDPRLIETLAREPEPTQEEHEDMVWSLLYLRAGERGLRRLKTGLRRLEVPTESSTLAGKWLNKYAGDLIRPAKEPKAKEPKAKEPKAKEPMSWEMRSLEHSESFQSDSETFRTCRTVHYCRVHDYYDEHNPWIVFMGVIEAQSANATVVLFSAKDVYSHQIGVASGTTW